VAGAAKNQRVGPFELDEIIGSGGFGTVYRGTAPDGSPVALKILAPHVDSQETIARFQREGTIRIEHPNVVRVIDAGQDDDVSYIAFELLEGQPLVKVLEDAPLPLPQVLDLAAQICAGLSAAHARGIVHRDLKPGNVFCCDDGSVKILDFGIARPMSASAPQLTMAGSVVGTPGYLSPEQARGDSEVTPAADLWALGVILYQAISGENPFIRTTAVATILAVVLEEAPPLDVEGGLPEGLTEAIDRCLQKDPGARWATADALAEALGDVDPAQVPARVPVPMPSIPVGERRVVALLFAAGVHDLPRLQGAIEDLGGELIPMLGGAIGLFGGRTYEGDEASRAVRAALSARAAADRIAVASGRAIGGAGTVGGEAVRAVERAAREDLAGVAVDALAARQLTGQFELVPVSEGLFEVPRALSARESGSFPRLREDLPLLGRRLESGRIDDAIARAFVQGQATILWVDGPPGIGKTRLRAELERELDSRRILTMSARGESHRRDASFHVFAELIRSIPELQPFFLNPSVPNARRHQALAAFLEQVFDDPAWLRQSVETIGRLLGLDEDAALGTTRHSDPQLMADRMRMALSDLIDGLATEPLAIVIDDAQWVDVPTLYLLDDLLGRLSDRRFLIFLAARPELAEEQRGLFADRAPVRIEPRGLTTDEVQVFASAIAEDEVPPVLARAIASRTGGNPFFVEQIMRELVEKEQVGDSLLTLPIPLDVEGAVQSRLDHLPAEEKRLLKRAAIFDGSFTEGGLRALEIDDPAPHLRALVRRGLLTGRRVGDAAEREYRFLNELVGDVAYRMSSEEALRDLHRRAAAHLGEHGDPEQLARHLERGDEPERAATAYVKAAQLASARGDTPSVLRCTERALALGVVGSEACELHLVRADALSFVGDKDAQRHELHAALKRAQTPAQKARALSLEGSLLAAAGDTDHGLELAAEAVRIAREETDRDILAVALAREGWVLLYAGRIADASDAIAEAASQPDLPLETQALVAAWRAQLYTAMGDLYERKLASQDAIERYRALGDLRRAATQEVNLADTLNRVGAYDEAERALRTALDSCRRVDNRVVEGYALANLGYALAGQERLEDALEAFDQALARADELGRPRLALAVRVYRARARLGHAPADELMNEARAVAGEAQQRSIPAIEASALAVASRAALAAGDAAGALADAERAMHLRDEIGTMEEDEAEIFLGLSEALRESGQPERAREVVARGASRLEFLAGRIRDTQWRARFLVEVPINRRLIELDGKEDA